MATYSHGEPNTVPALAPLAPQPYPSARFLTVSPWRRRDGPGQRAIAVVTLAFAPVKRAIPGVRLGSAGQALQSLAMTA